MIQDDKSAPDLELVKLTYHTAHKAAENIGIPIPIVVSALVHAASVMAQIYEAVYGFRGVNEGSNDLAAQQSLLLKSAYLGSSSYVPVRS